MKWLFSLASIAGFVFLLGTPLQAGDPLQTATGPRYPTSNCPTPYPIIQPPCGQPGTTTPGITMPGTTTPGSTTPGQEPTTPGTTPSSAFAQAGEAGTQGAASFNPNMFGDLVGASGLTRIIVRNPNGATPTAIFARAPISASASGFKISENESPRPQCRAFFAYNFYNDVNRSINPPGVPTADLHREMIGFESTFLNGDASFGMRLPFLEFVGDSTVENSNIGDLSLVFKYAFINDRQTGNVLSAGMVLTLPTGQDFDIIGESSLHSTIFQPYLGYIYNPGDFYFQGFSSVAVPTDSRDVTLLFNSFGLGYRLYSAPDSGRFLTGIVPTLELHVNTPLNHRGALSNPIGFPDLVDWTAGTYFLLREKSSLGVAMGAPITGPRPYDIEAIVSLNFRF